MKIGPVLSSATPIPEGVHETASSDAGLMSVVTAPRGRGGGIAGTALRVRTGARRGLIVWQRRWWLLPLVLVIGGVGSGAARAAVPAATDVVSVAATPAHTAVSADYLGLSLEYNNVSAYEGVPPRGAPVRFVVCQPREGAAAQQLSRAVSDATSV